MKRLVWLLRVLLHQSLIAQAVTAGSALVSVALLARGLSTNDYAHYAVVTAVWAIGNAVVGTGTGTRVAKSAANGSKQIHFQQSELWISIIAGLGTGAYLGFVRSSIGEGLIAALCMMSFIAAEAGTSFEIGHDRFNRYLSLLALRALLPPILLSMLFLANSANFAGAMLCVLAGNIASIIIWPRRYSLMLDRSRELTGHSVGAINMGLWIMASADRLVLERIVTAHDLATYALAYGLTDRVYRSLSNAYIARSLGKAFKGETQRPGWRFYLSTSFLAALLVPGIQMGTNLLSGNRYNTSLLVTACLSLAGLFMIWAAPAYVRLMASDRFRSSLICVFGLAAFNVAGNLVLAQHAGTTGAALLSMSTYAVWFAWLISHKRNSRPVRIDGARHLKTAPRFS